MNINIATWGRLVRRAIPTVNHSGTFSPQAAVSATGPVVDAHIPELTLAARYAVSSFLRYLQDQELQRDAYALMYVMYVKSVYSARRQTFPCSNFGHPFYRQIYTQKICFRRNLCNVQF